LNYADELIEHIEDIAANEPYISQTDRDKEIKTISDFLAWLLSVLILPNYKPDPEDVSGCVFF